MSKFSAFQGVPLPKDWPEYVKLAVIHSIALAHKAITYSRSFAIDSSIERVRLAAQLDRAQGDIALLREEIRIKDARMGTILPRSGLAVLLVDHCRDRPILPYRHRLRRLDPAPRHR